VTNCEPRRAGGARAILGGLFVASLAFGAFVFREYRQAERHLHASLKEFERKGESLGCDGCVDAVVAWAGHCPVMRSMCEFSVPHLMTACLSRRDRKSCCENTTMVTDVKHFSRKACKARQLTRSGDSACDAAYDVLALRCRTSGAVR
jgi:hypothetical protein